MYQQAYPSLKIGTVCIVESVAGEVMGNSGSHLYPSKVERVRASRARERDQDVQRPSCRAETEGGVDLQILKSTWPLLTFTFPNILQIAGQVKSN